MILHRVAAACVLVLISASVGAAETARHIQIQYDLTKEQSAALRVSINCGPTTNPKPPVCETREGPAAFTFQLKASDRVVIVLVWMDNEATRGEIVYAVTGTNLDDKDLGALKKIVGAPVALMATERSGRALQAERKTEITPVTDDLIAGGKLTVTFRTKKGPPGDKTETVVDGAGPLTFRIEAEAPRLTVSTGIVLTNAPEPQVAIVKSSTIVTFDKDGKTQQAYQQAIAIRDKDAHVNPIQSLVAMANFRLNWRMYASMGFQLNQNLFEEPLAGVTYRHPVGKVGLNVTAAIHFSREKQIISNSGFFDGYKIDPAMSLTVDDIPTEMRYHVRYAVGVTLDFF